MVALDKRDLLGPSCGRKNIHQDSSSACSGRNDARFTSGLDFCARMSHTNEQGLGRHGAESALTAILIPLSGLRPFDMSPSGTQLHTIVGLRVACNAWYDVCGTVASAQSPAATSLPFSGALPTGERWRWIPSPGWPRCTGFEHGTRNGMRQTTWLPNCARRIRMHCLLANKGVLDGEIFSRTCELPLNYRCIK